MSKDREAVLGDKFNEFVTAWHKGKKHLEEMTMDDVVLLKSALSTVNNIATLKTEELLVKRLSELSAAIDKKREGILRAIKNKSANANGFDIQWSDGINFVAEVKCNMPINGKDAFGSKQREGILGDLQKLRSGNKKTSLKGLDANTLEGYYKFLGVYVHSEKSKKAVRAFCDGSECQRFGKTKLLDTDTKIAKLDKNTIYIVMLGND